MKETNDPHFAFESNRTLTLSSLGPLQTRVLIGSSLFRLLPSLVFGFWLGSQTLSCPFPLISPGHLSVSVPGDRGLLLSLWKAWSDRHGRSPPNYPPSPSEIILLWTRPRLNVKRKQQESHQATELTPHAGVKWAGPALWVSDGHSCYGDAHRLCRVILHTWPLEHTQRNHLDCWNIWLYLLRFTGGLKWMNIMLVV